MSGRTPYERLLKQHCQKGVGASKSAGVVGRWGSTSFTSVRTAAVPGEVHNAQRKPKKFFKSRGSSDPRPDFEEDETITEIPAYKRPAPTPVGRTTSAASGGGRAANKFFTSRPPKEPRVALAPQPAAQVAEAVKIPPLRLRIKTPVMPMVNVVEEDSVLLKEDELQPLSDSIPSPSPPPSPPPDSPDDMPSSIPEPSYAEHSEMVASPEPALDVPPDDDIRFAVKAETDTKDVLLESQEPILNLKTSPPSTRQTSKEPVLDSFKAVLSSLPTKPEVKVESKKAILDDWDDEEEESRDAEVSFKVAEPVKPAAELILTKAQTVASSLNLAQELATSGRRVPELPQPPVSEEPSQALRQGPRPQRRSIFKTKGRDQTNKKGLYKHNWNPNPEAKDDDFQKKVLTRAVFGFPSGNEFDDDPGPAASGSASFSATKLVRVASMPAQGRSHPLDDTHTEVVSVKCPKEQKEYYTVIKNVKRAHQIQDSGEFQEFNDDVDYILEGLGAKNNLSTRCLSTVTLASKCMEASFRMHLRAHGTVTKFFGELKDAPQNASLALCAATVLFVLSQDRLNMDLDRESLELMLNLLNTESRIKDALEGSGMNKKELEKNKQKVQELVGAMKAKGHAINLSLDLITADHLAMETLLSLTSKRAGEWFKEELRELGGLDHLVSTLSDCVNYLTADEISMWTEPLHDKLKKAGRVLKVLENVTHENEENCSFLLKYQDHKFLNLIHSMFKILDEEVPLNPSRDINDKESISFTLREVLFDVMRVYINLVHDYHQQCFGSEIAGLKQDMFDITLHCLFSVSKSIPYEKRFDVLVLALTLLINLVENSTQNRDLLMKSKVPNNSDTFLAHSERDSAPLGLIKLFMDKEESARTEEAKTDNILDGVKEEDEEEEEEKDEEAEKKKTQEERIDETVAKLLHKAGRHMEDTLIGSYITLIIGYLIIDEKDHEQTVRSYLPDGNFTLMVSVLKKFFNFMTLTASASVTSSRGIKATEAIIKHMEKIDKPEDEKDLKAIKEEESFDDLTLFDVTKDETSNMSSTMNASGAEDEDASNDNFSFSDEFGKL